MDYINYLDSISIFGWTELYGYEIWVVIRDILAWGISIGAFCLLVYLAYNYWRAFRDLKSDIGNIKVKGSDGNYCMTALIIDTGFDADRELFRELHAEEMYTNREVHDKTRNRRAFGVAWRVFLAGCLCALVGAEWGLFCVIGLGFLITLVDGKVCELSYVYESYMDWEYEDEE